MWRTIKAAVFGYHLPSIYSRAARKHPVRNEVLFFSEKLSAVPDAFILIMERFQNESRLQVEFIGANSTGLHRLSSYRQVVAAVRKMATARIIFLDDASSVVSCLPLRRETKVVQLWHACGAFKKWGMSTAELKFGGTREDILRHPFYENLSLVTVSSPEVIWAYAEAMNLKGRESIIKPLGVSRTDIFFDLDFRKTAHMRIEALVPTSRNKRILLYAPTFRGRTKQAEAPVALDVQAMKEALHPDWVLLIKHHPFVKQRPPIPEDCRDFAFDLSGLIGIEDLLTIADACITDYSSIIFEYSLFERPMMFFAYDLDDYLDWRGFYYGYDDFTPGPVFRDNSSLIDHLKNLDDRFNRDEVIRFRRKFMSACDGHATERIIEEVLSEL